jgi:glycosyltransferase involved in cell wall biosynthesis
MHFVDDAVLLLIGSGDIEDELRNMVSEEKLEKKVIFTGKLPFELLRGYNAGADLGVSLEEDNCLNNAYALPNKLFDYIQAGIPVLCSALPEMKKIVEFYEIGRTLNRPTPESLAKVIDDILKDEKTLKLWKGNLKRAALDLCWEKEETKLKEVYREAGLSFDE